MLAYKGYNTQKAAQNNHSLRITSELHKEASTSKNKFKENKLKEMIIKRPKGGRRHLKSVSPNEAPQFCTSGLPGGAQEPLLTTSFTRKFNTRNANTRQGHRLKRYN
mmetsp:Transcript_22803/g.22638  ORF Transcript_22803/g.22638 Transcript_22803/m.22638 type:complete len:107 (-) Transcript_22803:362-682(-)